MKISVIMPVYNSEKYISCAVDSVLNQNFDGFELILVDDGSTDQSGRICDRYAAQDERVKVIHKQNGGICSARNAGIKIAKGEYLAFCDNDDKYLPGLLKDNYELAKKYDADIVRFRRKRIKLKENGQTEADTNFIPSGVHYFEGEEINKNYPCIRISGYAVWSAIYRSEIVRKKRIKFNESAKSGQEDQIFNLCYYQFCNSVVLNSKVYYCWIRRDGHSTTDKFNRNIIETMIHCIGVERRTYELRKVDCYNKGYWNDIILFFIYFGFWNMDRKCCDLNFWKKISILKMLRNYPLLTQNLEQESSRYITDTNPLGKQIMDLFYHKRIIQMYFLLKLRNQEY